MLLHNFIKSFLLKNQLMTLTPTPSKLTNSGFATPIYRVGKCFKCNIQILLKFCLLINNRENILGAFSFNGGGGGFKVSLKNRIFVHRVVFSKNVFGKTNRRGPNVARYMINCGSPFFYTTEKKIQKNYKI